MCVFIRHFFEILIACSSWASWIIEASIIQYFWDCIKITFGCRYLSIHMSLSIKSVVIPLNRRYTNQTKKRVINALLNEKRELKQIWNCFMKLMGECSGHAAGFSQNLKQLLDDLSCEHTCSPRSTLHFCADDADSSGVTRWLRHNGFVNKQSFSKSWYVFVCTDLSLICVIIVDISTH